VTCYLVTGSVASSPGQALICHCRRTVSCNTFPGITDSVCNRVCKPAARALPDIAGLIEQRFDNKAGMSAKLDEKKEMQSMRWVPR